MLKEADYIVKAVKQLVSQFYSIHFYIIKKIPKESGHSPLINEQIGYCSCNVDQQKEQPTVNYTILHSTTRLLTLQGFGLHDREIP